MRRLLAAALAAVFALACAAPAAAADGYVDVGVFATLDQPAYLPSGVMTMTVSVLNSGTATATGVVVRPQGNVEFAPWGDLGGAGIELAPGASATVYVTATASGADMTEQVDVVSAEPDRNPADNTSTVTAFVTVEQADLTVTVYGDADHDGVVDAGETRAGVLVTLAGGINATDVSARTDASGVVRFPGIPGGQYVPFVNLPKGWYIDMNQLIDIRAGTNTALIGATVNDMTALSASVSLDRDSYAPGDTIRERVTLTNSGDTDIFGVVAHCGGWGALDNVLFSTGWGELRSDSAGVVVHAGETRTWEFTDVVPSQARDYGFVSLRCDFSPDAGDDGPVAETWAAVPGGRGSMAGRLVDTGDKVLVGVKILLIDQNGVVAARAVSDGNGRFQFPDLPAGLYEVRPVGPWRPYEMAVFMLHVMAGQPIDFDPFVLTPGPAQSDPDSPPPTGKSTVDVVPAPSPQAAPVRPANLADTGANVVELAALGFLLLAAGALLVRARRA